MPFLPGHKEQTDDIAQGTCPTVTPTYLDHGYSVRIVDVTSFALAGKNLSSSSIPNILVRVVTLHDGLYHIAAAHYSLLLDLLEMHARSAKSDPKCTHCVYAGALHMREGHTYIIIRPDQSTKFSPRNFRFVQNAKVFSLKSFPLYGIRLSERLALTSSNNFLKL